MKLECGATAGLHSQLYTFLLAEAFYNFCERPVSKVGKQALAHEPWHDWTGHSTTTLLHSHRYRVLRFTWLRLGFMHEPMVVAAANSHRLVRYSRP